MRTKNLMLAFVSVIAIVFGGLACKSLSGTTASNTTANAANNTAVPANDVKAGDTNSKPTTTTSKVEKADFTYTSEDLDKEYNKKGVTSKDLEKFSNKNIAVTGRVTMLITEKKGTTQPWVTLFAPGIGNGVNCYFDDENVDQMKMLKEDKMAKIQGFQDDFVVPEVSPMLKHCVVIEGAN